VVVAQWRYLSTVSEDRRRLVHLFRQPVDVGVELSTAASEASAGCALSRSLAAAPRLDTIRVRAGVVLVGDGQTEASEEFGR
jgi:hypothetical protein